jgi:hypothetical protein
MYFTPSLTIYKRIEINKNKKGLKEVVQRGRKFQTHGIIHHMVKVYLNYYGCRYSTIMFINIKENFHSVDHSKGVKSSYTTWPI